MKEQREAVLRFIEMNDGVTEAKLQHFLRNTPHAIATQIVCSLAVCGEVYTEYDAVHGFTYKVKPQAEAPTSPILNDDIDRIRVLMSALALGKMPLFNEADNETLQRLNALRLAGE